MDFGRLGATINAVEFDHPFRITEAGSIDDSTNVYGPTVTNDPDGDVYIESEGWSCITGLTGQYGYHGAVMHSSEGIGGAIAEVLFDLAENDRSTVFVITVVDDIDSDYPVGWTVAYSVV